MHIKEGKVYNMRKLMLIFMVVIACGFVLAMILDSMLLAVCVLGYSIIWSAFHIGDRIYDSF